MGEIPPAPGGWWSFYYNKIPASCKEGPRFFCRAQELPFHAPTGTPRNRAGSPALNSRFPFFGSCANNAHGIPPSLSLIDWAGSTLGP